MRDRVLLATKGGHVRTDGGEWGLDSSASHLRQAVDDSLKRLGVDQIALWQHHRPDPEVDYADVIGTLKEIHASGKVAMIGLSNADPDQIRAAHRELGGALVSVQNQFSPAFRSSRPEIDVCEELGLAFLPWSPLGGLGDAKSLAEKHPAFQRVADDRGVSAQQVALAWELAQSPVVDPDPRCEAPAVDHRLRGGRRPGADGRRGRRPRRRLTSPARATGAGPWITVRPLLVVRYFTSERITRVRPTASGATSHSVPATARLAHSVPVIAPLNSADCA